MGWLCTWQDEEPESATDCGRSISTAAPPKSVRVRTLCVTGHKLARDSSTQTTPEETHVLAFTTPLRSNSLGECGIHGKPGLLVKGPILENPVLK